MGFSNVPRAWSPQVRRLLVFHLCVLILFLPPVVPHTASTKLGPTCKLQGGEQVSLGHLLLICLALIGPCYCHSQCIQILLVATVNVYLYTCVLVYNYILLYWDQTTAILSILVLERLPLWAPADVNTLSTVAHSTANLYNCLESSTEINLAEMQMIVALFINYYGCEVLKINIK